MGRFLVVLGAVLVGVGLLVELGPRIPGLSRLGRLPGDLRIERPGFTFYFPIATSLLVSLVVTGAVALLRKK